MPSTQYLSSLFNGQLLNPEGSNLIIAEWIAPGTPQGGTAELIAPLHKHNHDDEAWYVLEGTLGFQIGDELVEVSAGSSSSRSERSTTLLLESKV